MRAVLAVGVMLSCQALASTVTRADVALLTRVSTTVVIGTVVRSTPRLSGDGARIVTETSVRVAEVWKGRAVESLTVTQPGGVVGDTGQKVEGAARFMPGEEVVLFLEARGNSFVLTGMAQGRFTVDRSGVPARARQDQVEGLFMLDPDGRTSAASVGPIDLPLGTLKGMVVGLPARVPGGEPTVAP